MFDKDKRPSGELGGYQWSLKSSESWLFVFICMAWANTSLGEFARAVFMRIPVLKTQLGYPATWALYGVVLLPALPAIFRTIKRSKLFFPLAVVCLYLLTYVMFPENETYLNANAASFFLTILPAYVLGLAWNVDKMAKPLYYVSIVALICCVLFSFRPNKSEGYGYDMQLAYAVLPHVCLILYNTLVNFKKFNAILSGGGVVFLMMQGTRGPLVCLFMFITLVVLFVVRGRNRFFIVLLGAFVTVIIAGGGLINTIALKLAGTTSDLGLSTRVFDAFLEQTYTISRGRDEIRDGVFDALRNSSSVFGYGMFGDRYILDGGYAHNLALEFWIDFGVVVGTILLGGVAFMVFRRYYICRTQSERAFLLLLICCSIGHLMFSSSYLTHGLFFLLLGVCAQNKNGTAYDRQYLEIYRGA